MNDEVLEIITSEDPEQYNRFFITGSGDENSIITYKTKYNNSDILKSVTEGSSRFRPLHCSELNERLEERGFNIRGIKFLARNTGGNSPLPLDNNSELWYYFDKTNSQIPVVETRAGYRNNKSFKCCEKSDNFNFIQDLDRIYNEIFGEDMTNRRNEIQFYSASRNIINLIEDVAEVELIKLNSDTYTNILNLSELISFNAKPGISGLVNMTVEYSKHNEIFVRDLSFQAFSYTPLSDNNPPVLKVDNYITEIENDVQVEYINNTIRLNPLNSDIDECVIIRCSVIYGNL